MGRTKGSKNGVRKVPIKKPKIKPIQDEFEANGEIENCDPNFLPLNQTFSRLTRTKIT